jgi:elongation factor P--(R)-beta-lysine ligase
VSLEHVADRRALAVRADMLARTRAFFTARGVLEVDTPALSAAAATEPALASLTTHVDSLGGPQYLQTSPELAMKRLLAAGSGDIYQVCRVFREDELGRWHQPEFTMLEWYRVGFDVDALMHEVGEWIVDVLAPYRRVSPIRMLRYADAFRDHLDIDPHGDCAALADRLRAKGIDADRRFDRDTLLDLALGASLAPSFPGEGLTFLFDYPASQAALARIRDGDPPVAERFEAFVGSLEVANGFHELADPSEQRRRFTDDNARRERLGRAAMPIDEAFLAALEHGLPDCAGVAVGFDRLVAFALDASELASALSFAHRRR